MLIEKEVIRPGTYFYKDAKGAPRKLVVTPELCKYWLQEGNKMLSSGLTVPVPFEHDFNAHPMTPADKLKSNAGWIKKYSSRDNKLYATVDIQDEEVARKLPKTIRWTSPWINSFIDGAGREWKGVISHLALTARPRIIDQEPFPSIAAALSMAADYTEQSATEGFHLSSAGRLSEKNGVLVPDMPIAFAIWSGAALAYPEQSSHDKSERAKKQARDDRGRFGQGKKRSSKRVDGVRHLNDPPLNIAERREDILEDKQKKKSQRERRRQVRHKTIRRRRKARQRKQAREKQRREDPINRPSGPTLATDQPRDEKGQFAEKANKESRGRGREGIKTDKQAMDHRDRLLRSIKKKAEKKQVNMASSETNSREDADRRLQKTLKRRRDERRRRGKNLDTIISDKSRKKRADGALSTEGDAALTKGKRFSTEEQDDVELSMADNFEKKKKPPQEEDAFDDEDDDFDEDDDSDFDEDDDFDDFEDDEEGKGGDFDKYNVKPDEDPSNDQSIQTPQGDVTMEELLCDLLNALGVKMPENVDEQSFKRTLYDATMAKIKELAGKGQAEANETKAMNKAANQTAQNTTSPAGQGGNPLIQQEQQPMYMSLEEINKLPDPMKGLALSMYAENQKLRTEMEASKKVTDSLRDAKLKEASTARAARVAMLGRISPKVKGDLEAMLSLPAMALSMGEGGAVIDPMEQTLAVLEKGLGDMPRLLTTSAAELSVQAQPRDNDILTAEQEDELADSLARQMGCPPVKKAV